MMASCVSNTKDCCQIILVVFLIINNKHMIMPTKDCCDMQKCCRYLMLRRTKTLLNK